MGGRQGDRPIDLNQYVFGGQKPYTFALSDGSTLPEGLKLENGILSGTPTRSTNGSKTMLFTVQDANGTKIDGNMRGYYWTKLPPVELTDPLKGATFINSISVGLSDSYRAKLSDKATCTLKYRCTKSSGSELVATTSLEGGGCQDRDPHRDVFGHQGRPKRVSRGLGE